MSRIAFAFALVLALAGIAGSAHAGPNPSLEDGLRVTMGGGG